MLKYLIDENVNSVYPNQLRRRQPELVVRAIGEPNIPPRGTLDPNILLWCEEYNFILVTNNRTSIPNHLTEHLTQKRHVPGIFILNPGLSIGQNLDELILVAETSFEGEYRDQIIYLPLTQRNNLDI